MTNLVSRLRKLAEIETPRLESEVLEAWGLLTEAAGELEHREKYANQMNEVLKENARLMHDIEAGSAEIAKLRQIIADVMFREMSGLKPVLRTGDVEWASITPKSGVEPSPHPFVSDVDTCLTCGSDPGDPIHVNRT